MNVIRLRHISILRKSGLLTLILLLSPAVHSEIYNLKKKKDELAHIAAGKSDPTYDILSFLREQNPNKFQSEYEWYQFVVFCEQKAAPSQGAYYAELCSDMGKKLQAHSFYQEAFYYLYKANKSIAENPPKDKEFLSFFHETFGLSYYYFKRFEDAREQMLLALAIKKQPIPQRIGILNTMGLINRDQGYIDSSKIYFEEALVLANHTKNEPWIGVLSGNLGHYYWQKNDVRQARRLCQMDYEISVKTKQLGSAVNALSLLIEIDIKEHKLNLAEKQLHDLDQMIAGMDYSIFTNKTYYKARTAVFEAKGNHKEALASYRLVVLYSDTISKRSDKENLQKTEFQLNFEQKQAELQLLQEKKKYDDIIIYGLVGITILLVVVFVYILNQFSKRRKREKELAFLRQERVQRELGDTEREMRTMLSNLIEKNALIEQLTDEIEQFQSTEEKPLSEERLKMLDKLQSFTLLTDDDWLEFKKLFEKLNPTFFGKVLTHSPDLTNAELRLITLIKLNLSNLEMSRALGISPDSVRKTSLRLRKKWNMDQHEDLVKFILTL